MSGALGVSVVVLLTFGSFASGANPNDLADQLMNRVQDYVLGEAPESWIRVPPIHINSTYYNYEAVAEPFPWFQIRGISRDGIASLQTTDLGQLLSFTLKLRDLRVGYKVYSHDDDGECQFLQYFASVDGRNTVNMKILILPHFDGDCNGIIHTLDINVFNSAEFPPWPLRCGQKSRDMIMTEMSNLHQTDIGPAVRIFVTIAVSEVLKDFNMCP